MKWKVSPPFLQWMNLCRFLLNVIHHCQEDLNADWLSWRKLGAKVQIFHLSPKKQITSNFCYGLHLRGVARSICVTCATQFRSSLFILTLHVIHSPEWFYSPSVWTQLYIPPENMGLDIIHKICKVWWVLLSSYYFTALCSTAGRDCLCFWSAEMRYALMKIL